MNDLVFVADSMGELKEKVLRGKECIETKQLKISISKTKVMV